MKRIKKLALAIILLLNTAVQARSLRPITPAPSPTESECDVVLAAVMDFNTRAGMPGLPKNPLAMKYEADLKDMLLSTGGLSPQAAEHFLLCALNAHYYQTADFLLSELLGAGSTVSSVFKDRLSAELVSYVEQIPHLSAAGLPVRFVMQLLQHLVQYGADCNYLGSNEFDGKVTALGAFIDAQKRHENCATRRAGCIPLERLAYVAVINFLIQNGATLFTSKKFLHSGKIYRAERNYLHEMLFNHDRHVYQLTLDEIVELVRHGKKVDLQKALRANDLMELLLRDATQAPLIALLLECGVVQPVAPRGFAGGNSADAMALTPRSRAAIKACG